MSSIACSLPFFPFFFFLPLSESSDEPELSSLSSLLLPDLLPLSLFESELLLLSSSESLSFLEPLSQLLLLSAEPEPESEFSSLSMMEGR